MTFHQIRFLSVSLAGFHASETCRHLDLGGTTLEIVEIAGDAMTSPDHDIARAAYLWSLDGGCGYILPVVVRHDQALFAGFIDTIAGTLTLQRERLRTIDQAIGYAFCAADIRSTSDRTGNHLPARILPFAAELASYLDAAEPAPEAASAQLQPQAVAA